MGVVSFKEGLERERLVKYRTLHTVIHGSVLWKVQQILKRLITSIYNSDYPAGNCMFKVNNRNTRTRCEICPKLTIKTPERR